MQRRVPLTIMRGGTSRALFFRRENLPDDPALQDRIIVAALGSPDPYGRQIDGLGGATATTNKTAIIGLRAGEPNTIDYNFGQGAVSSAQIDRKVNCGNISSAVGPFAIDEGLVPAREPETLVRIYNTNTQKYILAHVPVENGKAKVEGDYRISGVPGTGARVALDFESPGGAVTGKLLPTGNTQEVLETPVGAFAVTFFDAGNAYVFLRSKDVGLRGIEMPRRLDGDPDLLSRLETIRAAAAVRLGYAATSEDATRHSPTVPKIAFVAPPQDYTMTSGLKMPVSDVDIVAWMLAMGKAADTFAVTGSICIAGAAKTAGTIVNEMIPVDHRESSQVRLGHPSGSLAIDTRIEKQGADLRYVCATIYRTARRVMDGFVYVPEELFRR